MGQKTASHALWAAHRVCETKENNVFTQRELAAEMEANISSNRVKEYLQKLRENGLVSTYGPPAARKWKLEDGQ